MGAQARCWVSYFVHMSLICAGVDTEFFRKFLVESPLSNTVSNSCVDTATRNRMKESYLFVLFAVCLLFTVLAVAKQSFSADFQQRTYLALPTPLPTVSVDLSSFINIFIQFDNKHIIFIKYNIKALQHAIYGHPSCFLNPTTRSSTIRIGVYGFKVNSWRPTLFTLSRRKPTEPDSNVRTKDLRGKTFSVILVFFDCFLLYSYSKLFDTVLNVNVSTTASLPPIQYIIINYYQKMDKKKLGE